MAGDNEAKAKKVLLAAAWLRGLQADLVEPLLRLGRLERLKAGQWAHAEGDGETGILVVVEGAVQMFCQAPGDREILLGQSGAGIAIGQTMRFGGGPRLLTVVCVEDSLLLKASDRVLARIGRERPQIWQAVAALLYLQTRSLLRMFAEGFVLAPKERIAARLLSMTRNVRGEPTVRLSQQALGDMLGLTRKTVNFHLGEFERAGVIRRSYGTITLLDTAKLKRLAGV